MENLELTCAIISELQQRRKFYINAVNRLTNAAGAYIRSRLGWHYGIDEKEGKDIKKKAEKILATLIAAKDPEELGDPIYMELEAFRLSLMPVMAERDKIVREMETVAQRLPVASWVDSVPGFGIRGLAVIVGECGNLSLYKRGGLRKRLGLAPYQGKAYSTWRVEGGLTAEEWIEAKYSPRRRGAIYAFGESMFRAQGKRNEKIDEDTGEIKKEARDPLEPYGTLYYQRRARTAITHPDWTPGHSHGDALRIITQKLVDDLRIEWIACDPTCKVVEIAA